MPSQYCVRLLIANPAGSAALIVPGAPGLLTLYGPSRYVSGWAATVTAGALTAVESLVTFSDQVGGAISNVDAITFKIRDSHAWEIAFVGLFPATAQHAEKSPSLLDALMLAPAIAWPGGRVLCEPGSALTAAPGALTFIPS